MSKYVYRLLNDDESFLEIDKLRFECFNIKNFDETNGYLRKIRDGYVLVVGCYLDNSLVGGVYVSDYLNSLYIDQLFVKENCRRMHIGSGLLEFVFKNKNIFENYFNKKFDVSRLESANKDDFYHYIGYRDENNLIGTMRKKI